MYVLCKYQLRKNSEIILNQPFLFEKEPEAVSSSLTLSSRVEKYNCKMRAII